MFSRLCTFREKLYDLISHRKAAALDLIDANSSFNNAKSITQLSLSPFFRRAYNSITKVISDFKLNGDPKESKDTPDDDRTKLFQLEKSFIEPNEQNQFTFALDTTWGDENPEEL